MDLGNSEIESSQGGPRSEKELDIESVKKFFAEALCIDESKYKIEEVTRLHSRERENQGRPQTRMTQLLKVRFDREEMARQVLSVVNTRNYDNTNFKDVRLFRDRSKEERDQRKKMLAEARDHNEQEEEGANGDRSRGHRWYPNFRTGKLERRARTDRGVGPLTQ